MDKLLTNYVPKKKWQAIKNIERVNKQFQVTLNPGYSYNGESMFVAKCSSDVWGMCKNIKEVDLLSGLIQELHELQEWQKKYEEELNAKKSKIRKEIKRNSIGVRTEAGEVSSIRSRIRAGYTSQDSGLQQPSQGASETTESR